MTHRYLALALCAALAGCATAPPDRFYTLTGGAGVAASGAPLAVYIELLPVGLPQQVTRNQLVITTGNGRAELLEQERWAGPLAGEIAQALSVAITAELGAIDVRRTPYPPQASVYRISTDVQRFESAPGRYALVDAVWSVRQLPRGTVLTCRSVVNEPVAAGYDALVAGHRRALAQVAGAMSGAVRSLALGGPATCPAPRS